MRPSAMRSFATVWYDIMRSSQLRVVHFEDGCGADLQGKTVDGWTTICFDVDGWCV